KIGWQILSAAAVLASLRSSPRMAVWGSVDVIVTPLSDMQLLNAAKVVALIVRVPGPNAPAGSSRAHAARAADVLGFGLPNPPKPPPPPPGPRLAPGGRLNPPAGRLKLPEGRAPAEKEGTVTPCCARHAVYAANAAPLRPPGPALPAALLGAAVGVALAAGLTAGVVDAVEDAFVLPPPHAATSNATHALPAVMAITCVTRRTPISCSPMPMRSELLRRRARRDRQTHRRRRLPQLLHSLIGLRTHRPKTALLGSRRTLPGRAR